MKQNRKDFLKASGIIAAGSIASTFPTSSFAKSIIKSKGSKMKFTFKPYTLELIHVFTVAVNSRTTTPVMLTKIEFDGITGYGEASMPPYLGESHDTATEIPITIKPGPVYRSIQNGQNSGLHG